MLNKYLPGILMGLGIGGLISSTFVAFELAPMARDAVEEKKQELNVEKLSPKDAIVTIWPYVLPSAILTVGGTALVLSGNQININREAAALAAYTLTDNAYREYREKTKEAIGERKERDIREEIEKKSLEKNPLNKEVIITNEGDYLCYDAISGRYFKSNIDKLKRIELDMDQRIVHQMFVSLNEFYIELGLEPVSLGDEIGWHIDTGYLGMSFSTSITANNQLCLVMECSNPQPKYI